MTSFTESIKKNQLIILRQQIQKIMAPLQTLGTKIEDILENDETPVQKFYTKKTIFLTGGTGFFGKIILEKLIRVTNFEHIYLLVRNKKGKSIYERIEEIFDDPVFDIIKRDRPKYRHKVSVINGDCALPGLGISAQERQTLKENCQIVIHGAATVRFDEKLKIALAINVNGTKEILTLCKEMKQLEAVVHVSTAFANCNHSNIDEKFYKMTISGENASRLGDCLDERTLDNITEELIRNYPNTYTFTKALAEDLVKNYGKGLPITIFRPGIVIPTYKEPVPGWIDNMYGPSGIIIGVAAGILRVFHACIENTAHVVPVDMSINCLLASAWDIANNTHDKTPIYNYIPDMDNPLSWKTYFEIGSKYGSRLPITKSLWYQTLTVTRSKLFFNILSFLYHTLPAFVMDAGLLLIGKKPRMVQVYKKVHKFCKVMTYFSNNKWSFTNHNTRDLWSKLSKSDQEIFFFDMRKVTWPDLIKSTLVGIRLYVVKEGPETIPQAMKRLQRFKLLHYTLLYTLYTLGVFLIYFLISKFFLT